MKVAFIATIYNEEKSISSFLESLFDQSQPPNEVILVDAFSTDKTYYILRRRIAQFQSRHKKIQIVVLRKKVNRAKGRNEAIRKCNSEIIACSDAGCTLDKNWLKNITSPFHFQNKKVDVVAGYYKPIARNIFEKCLAAYTCVMPDKVTKDFLPSSRSIAFKKTAWKEVGGYPEELDTCEDLVFAKNLKKGCFTFVVAKNAIVFWRQRKNIIEAFNQFFRYAKGDGEAFYIRPQTPLLFLRYLFALFLLFYFFIGNFRIVLLLMVLLVLYILWSIKKNYRYVNERSALLYLPILQFTSDVAVISGMIVGLLKKLTKNIMLSK